MVSKQKKVMTSGLGAIFRELFYTDAIEKAQSA